MPSFKMPTIPIPGLREMSGQDIKSVLSDVRVPDVKMRDLDPRRIDLSKIDLPANIDLPKIDVEQSRAALTSAVSSVAATAAERNPLRRRRPSRWPFVLAGLAIAAIAFLVIRNASWLRARAADVGERIRERADANRVDQSLEQLAVDDGAFAGDIAIPIEPDPYAESLPPADSGYPTASEELAQSIGETADVASAERDVTESEYRFPAS